MRVIRVCVCVLTVWAASRALAAKEMAELSEAERKQVNEWLVERSQSMIKVSRMQEELDRSWKDTRYTSPEIDELRKQYQELQAQIHKLQHVLRVKVQALPEVKEKQQQLDALKGRVEELAAKVDETVRLPK